MWSGSVANIPIGWALCDGQNGTPDLRERFIVGASSKYLQASTGGSEALINHFHGTGDATLTVDQIPSHTHQVLAATVCSGWLCLFNGGTQLQGGDTPPQPTPQPYDPIFPPALGGPTGGGQPHNHGNTGIQNAPLPILPPYYALAFIMKL
jgi:microcystin-dependent protein